MKSLIRFLFRVDRFKKHLEFSEWRKNLYPNSINNLIVGGLKRDPGIDVNIENDNTNIVGTVCNLPIQDNAFKNVVLFQVLEHTDSPKDALNEALRVADNVYLTINVMRNTKVNNNVFRDEKHRHKTEFSPNDFKLFVNGLGIKIVRRVRLYSFWYSQFLPVDNFFGVHRAYDFYHLRAIRKDV